MRTPISFLLTIPALLVSLSAHAQSLPNGVPADYATWPQVFTATCKTTTLDIRSTVTPDAEMKIIAVKVGGKPVAFSLTRKVDTETYTDHGLYKREWKTVESTDPNDKKGERLTQAAVIDNGGQAALEGLTECIGKAQQEAVKDLAAQGNKMLKGFMEGASNMFKELNLK